MTYEEFASLPVGAKVKCINEEGWSSFKEGGVYIVTENYGLGVCLDGHCASAIFADDFILYEGEE